MVKTPTGYFSPSVVEVGGGVENRPVARGSANSSFFGHKMGKIWCYFSRVRPRALGR